MPDTFRASATTPAIQVYSKTFPDDRGLLKMQLLMLVHLSEAGWASHGFS